VPPDDSRMREIDAPGDVLATAALPVPTLMAELMGTQLETVRLLGRRTAELHAALSSRPEIPEFSPEPFTDFYRHGLYHGMLGLIGRTFDGLRNNLYQLSGDVKSDALLLLEGEPEVRRQLAPLRDERIVCTRIRHHGDFHLSHLLFTGSDVMILDFDGEVSRPMSERRIKRGALRDVASMIRSFNYVSCAVLFGQVPGIVVAN